jgi:predicted nucleotidyltransferase
MLDQSTKAFLKTLERLCRQYDLVALYAFGSRAAEVAAPPHTTETQLGTPESDVDIGALPARERHLSARDRVRLTIALEDLLDARRVDLVVLPEADPYLALDIVGGTLLYTIDADAEAAYQLYVLRRAGDLAPFERERRRMLLAGEAV